MSILNKNYIVTMPNGERWSVPVMVIAEHRAKHFATQHGGSVRKSYQRDTKPLFESDSSSVASWATCMMNWKDVEKVAVRLGLNKFDHNEGWINGPHEIKGE